MSELSRHARRYNPRLGSISVLGKSVTPAAALDSAQEVFDLSIECRRLFQIDRVASIGTDPETSVGKPGFEHQVGLKAADILVTHGEQYRNHHPRQLIAQVMQ